MNKILPGLALLGIVITGVGGVLGVSYLKNSPQYAVYQTYEALKNHDYQTFSKYVDLEEAVTNVTNRYIQLSKQQLSQVDCSKTENLGKCLGAALLSRVSVNNLVTAQKDRITATVKAAVENGNYFDESSFHLDNPVKEYLSLKVTTNQDGSVLIDIPNDKKVPVTLKLQKENRVWKIVDMPSDVQQFNQFLMPGIKF